MNKNKKSASSRLKKAPQNRIITRKRIIIGSAIFLLVLGFAAQVTFNLYIFGRYRAGGDTVTFTQLGENGARDYSKPFVMDSQGVQYMPEARLVLPATDAPYNELLYEYNWNDVNRTAAWINITTRQAVNRAINDYWSARSVLVWQDGIENQSKVYPALKDCQRGVEATFDAESVRQFNLSNVATVQLSDGRTLYMSLDNSKRCSTDLSGLLNFLKKAQSY